MTRQTTPPAERDRPPDPAPRPDIASADAGLAARIRDGDSGAFETLFRAHYAGLCVVTYRLLGSRADAEEVVQDVLGRIWQRRAQSQFHDNIESYCYRAVRNEAINRLRRRRREAAWLERTACEREQGAVSSGASRPVDERLVDDEMLAAVARAVEALPERCKLVFELKWQRGLRYAEIADALGIAEKTVENQLLKAIKAIRLALGDMLKA